MRRRQSNAAPGRARPYPVAAGRAADHAAKRRMQTMTSLRWDNVPKPRVERPPLLASSSKPARRKQKPAGLRTEEADGRQIELQDSARAARADARAASAKTGSSRCSACKARGVTLWKVAGRLVCARCRTANEMAYPGQPGNRQEPGGRKATRKERTVTVATAEKDIAWAARQGRQHRKSRTQCGSYQSFLKHYNLRRSEKHGKYGRNTAGPRGRRRRAHSARVLAQVSMLDLRAHLPSATSAWRYYGTFSASSTRQRR